jgi:hypothetical protein
MTENKGKWVPYVHDFIKYPGDVIEIQCQNVQKHQRKKNYLVQSFYKDANSKWSVLPRGFWDGPLNGEPLKQLGTTRRLKGDNLILWDSVDSLEGTRGRQELECLKCGARVEACEDENLFPRLDRIVRDSDVRVVDLRLLGDIVRFKN